MGSVAQQGGDLDDPCLIAVPRLALAVEDGAPGAGGDQADGRAFPGVKRPADGVVHRAPGCGAQRGDVVDEAVGGTPPSTVISRSRRYRAGIWVMASWSTSM